MQLLIVMTYDLLLRLTRLTVLSNLQKLLSHSAEGAVYEHYLHGHLK